jgi:hypothetical protein
MPRLPSRPRALSLTLLVLATGCATERTVLPATSPDLPDRFLIGTYDSDVTTDPTPGAACRSPLVDPRDGTRLTLFESEPGRGLYEVPDGRYGVDDEHLLQVDCGTGRVLGIVRR